MGEDVSQVAQSGADRQAAPGPPEGVHRGMRRRLGRVLGLGLAALAVVVAFAFARPGVRHDTRTPALGVALPRQGRDQPAPAPEAALAGVRMPDLRALGWRATGARVDAVAGRTASTEFYARPGATLAYTVVSGQVLVGPSRGDRILRDGVVLYRLPDSTRIALTWRRAGRSVVMSALGPGLPEMLDLAVHLTRRV
ncbi:MAG: hypothetical protein U0Y82_13915 [Thermoleophilia bacterium]